MIEEEVLTELVGGKKVPKDDLRIELCGTLDEANSVLGVARFIIKDDRILGLINQIQRELFIVGAECAAPIDLLDKLPKRTSIEDITRLKELAEDLEGKMPPIKHWLIPGDTLASAILHLSRAIIRRAERIAVKLRRKKQIRREVINYLNCLSHLLFILARFEAYAHAPKK